MNVAESREYLNSIPEDEPVFILRGRDRLSTTTIKAWLDNARKCGVEAEKIKGVQKQFNAIVAFQTKYPERTKLPD